MYFFLSDQNKSKPIIPARGDLMAYSSSSQYSGRIRFRGFSIKYVIEGTERYVVNGQKIEVSQNTFLTANHTSEGFVEIDSKKAVEGICIDIDIETLSSVLFEESFGHSDKIMNRMELLMNSVNYAPSINSNQNSFTGIFLKQCANSLQHSPSDSRIMDREFYYDLGICIAKDHLIKEELQNEKFSKKIILSSQEFKKLLNAKLYMDEKFTSTLTVRDIATQASMSEFRFFRLFKQYFGESPYRYLLKKRLWYSCFLLQVKKASVTQASYESGFSDIYSFSRAYKHFFGISPKQTHSLFL